MKKVLIGIVLLFMVVFVVLFGKITKVIKSDSQHFTRLKVHSKIKYIIKSAFTIIDINVRSLHLFNDPREEQLERKKILLLGASIGHAWYINQYFNYIENLAVYNFDKRKALLEYLTNEGTHKKPDAVILKECAAFITSSKDKFDEDFDHYKEIYEDTVKIIRENDVIPVIATVCPVASTGPHLNNILTFNDWLKQYALDNNLAVIDIERGVRTSESDRRLRKELSQEDGLHLNREAYEKGLNPLVVPALKEALNLN